MQSLLPQVPFCTYAVILTKKHLIIDVSIQYSYIPYIEHRTGLLLR